MRAYRPWLAITLGVVVLVFWQLISVSGAVAEYFLPAPTHIIDSLITSIRHANMLGYAWVTLREAILGCMFANCAALCGRKSSDSGYCDCAFAGVVGWLRLIPGSAAMCLYGVFPDHYLYFTGAKVNQS